MTYPDRKKTLSMLAEWQAQHAAVNSLMYGLGDAIGLTPEGPLFATVWGLFDAHTRAISELVGDNGDWLEWYCCENDMGAKGMTAGYDGKTKKIKTLAHLWALIEKSRARE